jgi:hypothetical protein
MCVTVAAHCCQGMLCGGDRRKPSSGSYTHIHHACSCTAQTARLQSLLARQHNFFLLARDYVTPRR